MRHLNRQFALRLLPIFAIFLSVACSEVETAGGEALTGAVQMRVFKQPSCKCCGKWVKHMESDGFEVTVNNRQNLNAIKKEFGIKPRYQSCHTGVADGYVFEGHIPASVVEQFLDERPADAIGLAVPGMPVGSPGMEMGNRFDRYDVLLLKKDGSSEVYAHIARPEVASQSTD